MSQAREEGREEGLAEGEAKGREEGEKIGERKKAIETARKMIADGLPAEVVSKYSGLSIEEIKALQ